MAGLPVELTTRLTEQLGIDYCVVAGWIGITPKASLMTPTEVDAFCRLADLVGMLMNVLGSDQVTATRWLT